MVPIMSQITPKSLSVYVFLLCYVLFLFLFHFLLPLLSSLPSFANLQRNLFAQNYFALKSKPSKRTLFQPPKESRLWGITPPPSPPRSFIWAGPPHQSPFKSSGNAAANWAGGGGSVAETEGVFGDLVALGFRGHHRPGPGRVSPYTFGLQTQACHFTKLLSVSTSIQKGEKICTQFLS